MRTYTSVLSAYCGVLLLAGCTSELLQGPEGLAVESAVVAPTGPAADSVVFTMTTINVSRRTVALPNVGDPRWLFDVFVWDSYRHVVWRRHPYPFAGPSFDPPLSIAPGQRDEWTAVWHLASNEGLRVSPGTYWLVGFLRGAGGVIRSDSIRFDVVD